MQFADRPKMALSAAEIQQVLLNRGIFMCAQLATGVPWQAIAAVWYRESFSSGMVKTPGGPFQFDPPNPSSSYLESLVTHYSTLSNDQATQLARTGINYFASAAVIAACKLRQVCRYDLAVDHSDAAMKDAFYGYNGRAYGPDPDNSPYVMNNFDSQHMNMHISGSVPLSNGGRQWIHTIDRRPGAFVVYKQLLPL